MAALRINTHWSKLVSHAADIADLIGEVSEERLKEAGKHARKIMHRNVGHPGPSTPGGYPAKHSGYLQKKIAYKLVRTPDGPYVMVGAKAPHAHLVENKDDRPFINESLEEAAPGVAVILAENYF